MRDTEITLLMAFGKLFIILAVAIALSEQYEVEAKDKAQKALEAEKGQKTRSASPGREKGSFQILSSMMGNKTEGRRASRRRGQENLNTLWKMNRKSKQDDNTMMNDNEGAIAINQKPIAENETSSLADKMKELRREGASTTYEAVNNNDYVPQVTGVFCNFENSWNSTVQDMCMWQWNQSVSGHGLGFNVVTAADIVNMNETTRGLSFSGPKTDADENVEGHFLYLPVDPTMENMVIKSPLFQGLWEFCKFEVTMHQSKMQNASIRLISESSHSEVQWILQEIAGNNDETWIPFRFMIGKVQQRVRIIVEVTRPAGVVASKALPHVAMDNLRMLECLPEPPVINGQCHHTQLKCNILHKESCIKLQQVCDLVKDCDDGSDENQNCDKMPYGSYCNFEQDSCGFKDFPLSILKWSRHSGPTPTDKTGPDFDHTCGPTDINPTPALPPLSPARINFSLSQCIGYYFFVNMNVTGPNKEKADFASRAIIRTVIFNPPPKVHGNITSRYYNCCMIRFYYQQNGRNYGSLSVEVVELTGRGNITTSLWFSTKDKGENWYRAAIFLPNITRRYFLQFKTRMGMRIYSDSAIDDFSMAPECFGLNIDPIELGDYNYFDPAFEEKTTPHPAFADKFYYRLSTCGAVGRQGPTQAQCDAAYNGTLVSVHVLSEPPLAGVQMFQVPEEGMYTIIAIGAGGGDGAGGSGASHGASVRALVALHRNQRLYVLPGHQGTHACKKALSAQESQDCGRTQNDTNQLYTSKTHEVRNTHVNDGGGGGGGGTFVFTMDDRGKLVPLIVAGGGGGISVGAYKDDGSQHAKGLTDSPPESGYMYGPPGKTSGAGGGWAMRAGPVTPGLEAVRGEALAAGARGGVACAGGAHGGFGGGGGACLRGGGGGGWIGGNTNDGEGLHGGGGWSYVDQIRAVSDYTDATLAARSQPGEVLIIPAIHDCGCDYRCVALNEYRSEVKCYCPGKWSEDGTRCVLSDQWNMVMVIAIVVVITIVGITCCFAALCMYNSMQKNKEVDQRQKRIQEQEVQLHRLRAAPGGNENPLTMAFNPHYGSETILPHGIDVRGLPQVSRESLKLIKALGQGAFGEVYQGLYRHRTGDTLEMPVAVKTLPELSTGQAESDFLMEAAIMAKFNHPNVVHLIGVCFDKHPRFIVLELLAGGDLKNFLRESRPKPERASALTMKDLLLCSLDVCKGCRYLEAKRFIHRDIAARNCLLTSRGPGRVVKIADFGMARDIYRADYYKKGGKAMLPIKWMPPEAYIDGVFTIKTDVWSFGVLLWEVFALGVMPYTGCTNREVMEMVSGGGRLEKPYGCPQEIYRLMCECWNPTSTERPAFSHMIDRLQIFLQDPEIVTATLPVVRSLLPPTGESQITANGPQRATGDYLVPMSPRHSPPTNSSSTDQLVHHSNSPTGTQDPQETDDSQYQPLLKASQEYGNIPMTSVSVASARYEVATAAVETKPSTKFLPSNSTDRLLSSVEVQDDSGSDDDDKPAVWETSFTEPRIEVHREKEIGPAVDKLISITPTSPKPPENVLSKAIEANVIDKTNKNSLLPDKKSAPIASPDPPRINAWANDPPKLQPKPKPLCLDAAQLEQNLNALKKNSGSVNLNTMNIVPPYINVVTPNKLSEAKTIQIDPKKAVIHDLQSPDNNEAKDVKKGLKQSSSAASLLNGPMTDVPYADSDNGSSGSSGNHVNQINNAKNKKNGTEVTVGKDRSKIIKQGSNGEFVGDSEINC